MRAKLLILLACSLLTSTALAQDGERKPRLTDRGRTMLTGAISASYSPDDASNGSHPRWAVDVRPGFYRFIRDRLALGVYLGIGARNQNVLVRDVNSGRYLETSDVKFVSAGGGVHLLYEIVLGEKLGLALAPWLGYSWWKRTNNPTSATAQIGRPVGQADSFRAVEFGIAIPLLFHFSDAVGLGVGPSLEVDYADAGRFLQEYGLSTRFFWSF